MPKSRRGNCLALPHASYSPVLLLKAGFTSDDVRVRVLIRRVQHDDPVKTVFWFLLWLCRDLVKTRLSESQAKAEEQNQSFPFCFWVRLTKQPTMHKATTGFPAKWSLWNECENSILMAHHYPDLGSADFWLVKNLLHASTFREYL